MLYILHIIIAMNMSYVEALQKYSQHMLVQIDFRQNISIGHRVVFLSVVIPAVVPGCVP